MALAGNNWYDMWYQPGVGDQTIAGESTPYSHWQDIDAFEAFEDLPMGTIEESWDITGEGDLDVRDVLGAGGMGLYSQEELDEIAAAIATGDWSNVQRGPERMPALDLGSLDKYMGVYDLAMNVLGMSDLPMDAYEDTHFSETEDATRKIYEQDFLNFQGGLATQAYSANVAMKRNARRSGMSGLRSGRQEKFYKKTKEGYEMEVEALRLQMENDREAAMLGIFGARQEYLDDLGDVYSDWLATAPDDAEYPIAGALDCIENGGTVQGTNCTTLDGDTFNFDTTSITEEEEEDEDDCSWGEWFSSAGGYMSCP